MKKLLVMTMCFFLFGFTTPDSYNFIEEELEFVEKVYKDNECKDLYKVPSYILTQCSIYKPLFRTFVTTEMDHVETYEALKNGWGDKLTKIVQDKHQTDENVLIVVSKPDVCEPIFYYLNGKLDINVDVCRSSKYKTVFNKHVDLDKVCQLPIFNEFISHRNSQGFLHLKTKQPTKNLILNGAWERIDVFVIHSGNDTVFMVTASYFRGFKPGEVFKSTFDKYPHELETYTIKLIDEVKKAQV